MTRWETMGGTCNVLFRVMYITSRGHSLGMDFVCCDEGWGGVDVAIMRDVR